MRFENTFDVVGEPVDVIEVFDDLPLVASFLPGANIGPVNDDGRYPGSLTVSFGPKRITFTGLISQRVDKEGLKGVISGNANADIRGAKMAVTLNYSLANVQGTGGTTTKIQFVSDAQLTGVLAEFAKTGGVVVTNAILAEFGRRLSAYLANPAGQAEASPAASATAPDTLSLSLIVLGVLRSSGRRVRARLASMASRFRSGSFK